MKILAPALIPLAAAAAGTTCNPLVLPDYPVGLWCRGVPNGSKPAKPLWRVGKTEQYRELADPTLLVENGEYWLFPSCGAAWKSRDGATWEHLPVDLGEIGYAPTVVKHEGVFYAVGSDSPVYAAKRLEGPWEKIGSFALPPGSPPLADPMLFSDGGKLYLYWGCTPKGGIWGGEVVLGAKGTTIGVKDARELVKAAPLENEWMRCGGDPFVAWMEGAWMVKIGAKYALVYSAGGTENASYAMGVAYADSPLGEFAVAPDNPFFKKIEGVVTGTGHGSIAKGSDGLWRIAYCVAVGARHGFERVVGMDVLDVDETAGRILKTTPTDAPRHPDGSDTLWRVCIPASPAPSCDGSLATAQALAPGGRLVMPLAEKHLLRAFRVVWRDVGLDDTAGLSGGPYRYRVHARSHGEWQIAVDASENNIDLFVDYRETPPLADVDAIMLEVVASPHGITPAVAELTAFGE